MPPTTSYNQKLPRERAAWIPTIMPLSFVARKASLDLIPCWCESETKIFLKVHPIFFGLFPSLLGKSIISHEFPIHGQIKAVDHQVSTLDSIKRDCLK